MILFTENEIQNKVKEIATIINQKQHEQPPVFICVLNGAFMFFTDLVKHINDCNIDFIRAKSYTGTTQGEIYITKQIEIDITERDVYLVDDIYDSGNTINSIIKHIQPQTPKSITPVTLFKKEFSYNKDLIWGFELSKEYFLIGYGLDGENGLKRNQKHISGKFFED
jgi:hypoxanthine phosphoribosyltransferase